MPDQPPPRPTARVVLLDPDNRVLLLSAHDTTVTTGINPLPRPDFWLLVGGGLEPGEDFETALRREIHEEIGLDSVALGAEVGRREKTVSWAGTAWAVHERYFAGRVLSPVDVHFRNHTPVEIDVIRGCRWWTPAEISASNELFVPPRLLTLIERAAAAI